MDLEKAEDWICRAHCIYFKPDRVEEERCRGFTLACRLTDGGVPPQQPLSSVPFDPEFKRSFFKSTLCDPCPFFIDGCDFTSPDPPEGCLPCGGLVLLSRLLKEGRIQEDEIAAADLMERTARLYLGLTDRCALKHLEEPYLYHLGSDELYEVNEEALGMLLRCDGSRLVEDLQPAPDFLRFCMEEDLQEMKDEPFVRRIEDHKSPIPSLRYLEWITTRRCNLSCAHCYLGDAKAEDYPRELIRPLLDQFTRMQGLRLLVSGGEPTVYPHFDVLNRILPEYPIRSVLLTNGLALTPGLAARLNFHEVQVSLDGMERGHELVRGKGSFRRAVSAMEAVRAAGLDLSVATMIHRGNLDEWDAMQRLVTDLGAREWSIDYPCSAGRWTGHPDMAVDPVTAAEKMAFGFGGSYHGSSPGWTCGRHLAAVLPDGNVCRCGLIQERIYGSVSDGLADAWQRIEHIPIDQTECAGCPHADECGGGCRFRAGDDRERDEVMCRCFL